MILTKGSIICFSLTPVSAVSWADIAPAAMRHVKLAILGDRMLKIVFWMRYRSQSAAARAGKTCLCYSYYTNSFPEDNVPKEYEATVLGCHSVLKSALVQLPQHELQRNEPWKTLLLASPRYTFVSLYPSPILRLTTHLFILVAEEAQGRLRGLNMGDVDVAIVVFSLNNSDAFQTIPYWIDRCKRDCPKAPVLLCGSQKDITNETGPVIHAFLDTTLAQRIEYAKANFRVDGYYECSALTQEGLKAVFDAALEYGLGDHQPPPRRNHCTTM